MATAHVKCHIIGVSDAMLPDAALPNTVADFWSMRRLYQTRAEPRLDQPPPPHRIMIPVRQGPDRVQMVGHHYPCRDLKRMLCAGHTHGLAQTFDMLHQQVITRTVQRDGKVVTVVNWANGICHPPSLPRQRLRTR